MKNRKFTRMGAMFLVLAMICTLFASYGSTEVRAYEQLAEPSGLSDSGAPTITTQPKNVTAELNAKVSFTVAASGNGLTYQWQYRASSTGKWTATTLTGAKTAILQVTATTARNGYQYRCVVTDADGNKTESNAATLIVGASQTLAITAQPQSVTAALNDTVKFTVAASGNGLTYQWQWRKNASGTWAATTATGNKTATMSVTATTTRNGYQYRCVITDASGKQVTSNAVTLTVGQSQGPVITAQPKSVTAEKGSTVSFTVTATGNGLTYQWQYRTASSGSWYASTLTGAKTATLKATATDARNGYQYRCVITDANGNKVTSDAAVLTIGQSQAPVITAQPQSVTAEKGSNVSFSVTATGNGLTYQWQWRKNASGTWSSTTATGNKTATITVTATDARNGYQYRCKITDGSGTVVYSQGATLTVGQAQGTVITAQPKSVTAEKGTNVKFSVTATGNGLTYQWQYRTATGTTWYTTTVTGAKTNTITVTATDARNGYQYRCVITDANGNKVTSNGATLTIGQGQAPVITAQPQSVTAEKGSNVSFSVTATGNGLTYQWQWRKNASGTWSSTTATGNKTATITVTATDARNGYQYRCKITDGSGTVIYSEGATLTIGAGLTITGQPKSVEAEKGTNVSFSVTATGNGLTYQWQWRKNSSATWASTTATGNKTNTITVTATDARNGYQYRCKITDGSGTVIYSEGATLTLKTAVVYNEPTLIVGNATVKAGAQVDLIVSVAKNPGIIGLVAKLEYDDTALTINKVATKTAFADLNYQKPFEYANGCNLIFYCAEIEEVADGEAFYIRINVAANAKPGTYPIALTVSQAAANGNKPVTLQTVTGSITVE